MVSYALITRVIVTLTVKISCLYVQQVVPLNSAFHILSFQLSEANKLKKKRSTAAV